jgi:Methyltransferase domain/Tetratricopeptide repeat
VTRAYYQLASERLAGASRVLDAGAGAGAGARILAAAGFEVAAVDVDRAALDRVRAPGVTCHEGDLATLPHLGAIDGAVVVDVLGHVASPLRAMLGVRARLEAPAARIVVAEARAYPTQTLRAPARRAFSARALAATVESAGFEVEDVINGASPFVALVARGTADGAWQALVDAARAADAGDASGLFTALERAAKVGGARARAEAHLTAGDVHFSSGDGDSAARAYFAARDADPKDPRPVAALARLALVTGDAEAARALALSARALDPTCPRAASTLAQIADARRERHDAWLIASALAPDDAEIAIACAEHAMARGDHAAGAFAIERLRRYDAQIPARATLTLAHLLDAMGRPADATLERRVAHRS